MYIVTLSVLLSAGASGGVYSLIAAHLATLALNWQEDSSVRIQKVKLEEDTDGFSMFNSFF